MSELNDTVKRLINSIPNDILTETERAEFNATLDLMPITSSSVDDLRESQIELMRGVSNMFYILKTKLRWYQNGLAPIQQEVETDVRKSQSHKPTVDQLALAVKTDARTKQWLYTIESIETLLDFIKHLFETLDHRSRMVQEKSVDNRHLSKTSY